MGLLSGIANGFINAIIDRYSPDPEMTRAIMGGYYDQLITQRFIAKSRASNRNSSILNSEDTPLFQGNILPPLQLQPQQPLKPFTLNSFNLRNPLRNK